MGQFRKLTTEEVRAIVRPKSRREVVREEYQAFLAGLAPGEGGEIRVPAGASRATIRYRLRTAARALNKRIVFLRTPGSGSVTFRVE